MDVGHIVFQLQGDKYKTVEIRFIEAHETTLDRVYSLKLPGDQRALHLNGYLVDTNHPDQTLQRTIDALRKVPGSKRLGVLSHCPELQQIFLKFDGECISERLNWELFGRYSSPDGESPGGRNTGKHLSFDDYLDAGKVMAKPVGIPVSRLTRGFSLAPDDPSKLPSGYQLPTLTLVDGYLLIQDEVQIRSTCNPRDRCLQWTRELQDQNLFEHGAIEIYPDGVGGIGIVYLSSESEAHSLPPRDQTHSFKARAQDLESPRVNAMAVGPGFHRISTWKLTLDRKPWPKETKRDKPEDPVDGGILEQGAWISAAGHQTPVVRLPLVEQLRDQINRKYNQKLGDFYKVTSRVVDGDLEHTVYFNRAPLVPFVSDAGPDLKKTLNVGFKSDLGIDLTLPALYQQMTFKFDVQFHNLTGHFFEYDPTKRGFKGDR